MEQKNMEQKKKNKKILIFKIIVSIIVIAILIGATIYLFPVMKDLSTNEGQLAFKEKIQKSGAMGFLMIAGLELAQIFLAVLPGEPIEILAGMCYGGIGGTIFILLMTMISEAAIFVIVRKLGSKFVYEFCKEETVKKIERIMAVLFFIPGTPKDLLTYIAGLLPIKMSRFLVISTLARIPSVISSTLAGASIMNGSWKHAIIMYGVIFLIVLIIMAIYSLFNKDDDTKEALKTIK